MNPDKDYQMLFHSSLIEPIAETYHSENYDELQFYFRDEDASYIV